MKKRVLASILLLTVLLIPLHAFAEDTPTESTSLYPYSDADVLERGRLYYAYLNQFFSNISQENQNASEVTLTGAIGSCDTDYTIQSEFDTRASKGNTTGPSLYIEYQVTDRSGQTKTCYSNDLLPVGGHLNGGLAQVNYISFLADYSSPKLGTSILGNVITKNIGEYHIRINLADYAAHGYYTKKRRSMRLVQLF